MQNRSIQITGLVLSAVYFAFIIWLYATEPRSFKEVATGAQVAVGTYQVDQEKFDAGLALFRRDQFARHVMNGNEPTQLRVIQRPSFTLPTRFIVKVGAGFTTMMTYSRKVLKRSIVRSPYHLHHSP
jgi:hypothetical protein